MAVQYPQNTDYGSMSDFAAKAKESALKALQTPKVSATTSPTGRFANLSGYFAPPSGSTPEQTKAYQSGQLGYAPDQFFGAPFTEVPGATPDTKSMPLSQYQSESATPMTFSSGTPTEGASIKSFSQALGGGQYISDPSNKDYLAVTRYYDPKQISIERSGMPSNLYQIEHHIPLWAGGTDTPANKVLMTTEKHADKTKIQAIPYTLLTSGKLSKTEALAVALNWQDKDAKKIPELDNEGKLPLDVAQKIYDSWQKPAKTTWTSFIKEVPDAARKLVGKYISPFLPDVIEEPVKGAVGAVPFADLIFPELNSSQGAKPIPGISDKANEQVAGLLRSGGRIAGDILVFIYTRGILSKAMQETALGLKVATGAAKGAKTAQEVALAAEEAGGIPYLSNLLKTVQKTAGVTPLGPIGDKMVSLAGDVAGKVGKEKLASAAWGAALFPLLSQTHTPLEVPFEDRVGQIAKDVVYGAALPFIPHTVTGYSSIGLGTFSTDVMMGANAKDAFLNGVTMMGLHSLGRGSRKALNEEALKMPWYAEKRAGDNTKYGGIKIGGKTIGEKTFRAGGIKIGDKTYLDRLRIDSDTYRAAQEARINEANITGAKTWRQTQLGTDFKDTTKPEEVAKQNDLINAKLVALKDAGQLSSEELKREQSKVTWTGEYLTNPEKFTIDAAEKETAAINKAAEILATDWRKNLLGSKFIDSTDEDVLLKQNIQINKILEKKFADQEIDSDQLASEKLKAIVSSRTKYKEGLPLVIRKQEDIKDLLSLGEKMRENFGGSIGTPKTVDSFARNLTKDDIRSILDNPNNTANDLDVTKGYGKIGVGGVALPEPGKRNATVTNPVLINLEKTVDQHPEIFNKVYFLKFDKITGRYRKLTTAEATSPAYRDRVTTGYETVVVVAPAPENHGLNLRINENLPAWKRMTKPQNTVKIFLPVPEGEGDSSRILGHVFAARKGGAPENGESFGTVRNNINWAWDRAKIRRPTGEFTEQEIKDLDLYDPRLNKDSLAEEFQKRDKLYTLAVMTYIPETFKTKKGTTEKTAWAYLNMNKEVFDGELARKTDEITNRRTPQDVQAIHDANIQELVKNKPVEEAKVEAAETKQIVDRSVKSQSDIKAKEATVTPLENSLKELEATKQEFVAAGKEAPKVDAAIEETKADLEKVKADLANPLFSMDMAEENQASAVKTPLPEDLTPGPDFKVSPTTILPQKFSQLSKEGISGRKEALEIINMGKETTDPTYIKDAYDNREAVVNLAKAKLDEFKGNKLMAGDAFIEEIKQKDAQAGISDLIPNKAYDAMRRVFLNSVENTPTKTLSITATKPRGGSVSVSAKEQIDSPSAPSKAEESLAARNNETGEKMQHIYLEMDKEKSDYTAANEFTPDDAVNALRAKDATFMFQSGNSVSNMVGVSNPSEAYRIKNRLNYKSGRINEDAFRKHYFEDILKFPPGTSYEGDKLAKRAKLFDARQPSMPIYGKTIRNIVLKSPTLGDTGLTTEDFNPKVNKASDIEAHINKEYLDGGIYVGKEMGKEIEKNGGYVEERQNLKPYLDQDHPELGKVLHKGLITVMDKKTEAHFVERIKKQYPDFKLGKYDMISFEPNIKMGLPKSFKEAGPDAVFMFDTPSETYKIEYAQPKESKASFTLSTWAKMQNNKHGVPVNDILAAKMTPEIKKLSDFTIEAMRITDGEQGRKLIEDYKELGKSDYTKDLYSYVKKQVENGAWKNLTGDQIENLITGQWQNIMNGRQFSGDNYKLTMDYGIKKGEGKEKFVKNDEVMMSSAQWKSIGKPERVLVYKHPITDVTGMVVAKPIIGEEHGTHNLGKQNVVLSNFNVLARMAADFDGDGVGVVALGTEKGLPLSIGDYILAEQKSAGGVILAGSPPKRTGPDGQVIKPTYLKFGDKGEAQRAVENADLAVKGGKGVSQVASIGRIMEFIEANKSNLPYNIKIKRGLENKKTNIMISNIATDAISSPEDLRRLFAANPESKTIYDIILKNNFDFTGVKPSEKEAFLELLKSLQVPYNEANASIKRTYKFKPGTNYKEATQAHEELAKNIGDYNAEINRIPGVKKGPVQTAMELSEQLPTFQNIDKSKTFQSNADRAGVAAVEAAYGDQFQMTEPVKDFIKFFRIEKNSNMNDDKTVKRIKDKKTNIENYYRGLDLSPADKKSIIYWLATDKDANLVKGSGKINAAGEPINSRVIRMHSIITDSPTITSTYSKANEAVQYYKEPVKE